MEFANPNVLWGLLAVPVLVMTLVYDNRRRREDLEKFTGPHLAEALAPGRSWRKNLLKGFLKTAGFALLLIALAGPRFGSQLVKVEREGVDLVIALDTSLSMLAEDMLPNRLERAKQAIVDLIRGLKGDRVGIVVFAGDSFALCPLTVDYDAALMFTRSVGVDVVSEPGTNLEKAIDKSAALFESSEKRDRAIILVTDGENHEGNPIPAARKAGEAGIKIYTIGIGNPSGELIPERGTDGSVAGYKKDRRGETVLTQLDEKTLQEIAVASKGKYLPATREGLELKVLYNEISGMERKMIKGEFVERKKERFWIFLCVALLLLLLDAVITSKALFRGTRRRRILHTGAAGLALAIPLLAAPITVDAKSVDAGRVKSGNKYFEAGEFDKAITLYVESLGDTLKLPKNYQGVLYNVGNALFEQNKYEEAIDLYHQSYSEDSTLTGQMLYNRANAFLTKGDVGEAVESYVQALQYLPDDEDVRHNLELALKQLQQQQQQQQQQQDKGDQEEENQEQQQQNQKRQEQQPDEQDQRNQQEQQEEQQQQQQQPDSTQAPEPQPDSTRVPEPQLNPEEMQQLSKEDAMRILHALEEQEKRLQAERHKAAFRRKKSGKDW